jgi:asparagine synthase (glutamine-hydrolysing)
MCGIAGIVGNVNDQELLNRMLQSQHHRGPDATGKFFDLPHVALGHNRLSIIDLSADANQPFFDFGNRFSIVFNGEIYNYIELRDELREQYNFGTNSDTEVLLAAYIVWGKACLSKLNGMFAFAVWDSEAQSFFAARDRFGVKPFHYAQHKNSFYFASEIKAMHAAGIDKKPDEKVWASYFTFGSYGNIDETFFENIKQLPGGHYLEYAGGKLTVTKWYFFEDEIKKQPKNMTYEAAKSHYLELLKDSIRLRFRADVNVGFNISGGLDSAVLLAMVNEISHNSANINAYTFYCNHPDYDEVQWVESMIANTNSQLRKVLLDVKEIPDFAEKIQFHEDEPFGGIPTLAYAKIFEQARQDNVLVLLDGQGMDEQWAGYDYYMQNNESIIQGVKEPPFKTNVLSGPFLAKAEKPVYPKLFEDDLLDKQYRDIFYTKIPRALRFNDRISMAFSTELREPFLDYRLVEFAFSLPLDFKIKDGINKWMVRDIASKYLPGDLVFAPKRALQTPQREWLANELHQYVLENIEVIKNSPLSNWFNETALDAEYQKYQSGNHESSFHIWQWVNFALSIK